MTNKITINENGIDIDGDHVACEIKSPKSNMCINVTQENIKAKNNTGLRISFVDSEDFKGGQS